MEKEKSHHPYLKRFVAFILDWYLSTILAALPIYAFQPFYAKDLVMINRTDDLPLTLAIAAALLGLVIYTLYFCIYPLKEERGETLGRKWLGLELLRVR